MSRIFDDASVVRHAVLTHLKKSRPSRAPAKEHLDDHNALLEQQTIQRGNYMNKPDWKDAPEWANWLAQTFDGDWLWFENKPEAGWDGWMYNPNFPAGRSRKAGTKDWQDTRESRPVAM